MTGNPLPDAELLLASLADRMRPAVGPATGLVGIHTGGVWLAERLHAALGLKLPLGTLDVSFYRDDFSRKGLRRNVKSSDIPFDVDACDVVIVDDVISAGTSVRESVELIRAEGAQPVAVLIALDRQERSGTDREIGEHSATQDVAARYGIPVIAIACLDDLLAYLERDSGDLAHHAVEVAAYRARYGERSHPSSGIPPAQ